MGQSLADLQSRTETLEAVISRMRHDIRSALAPAMLAADMMASSADPKMQRSAGTVVRAIERVMEMLEATRETVKPRGES
jgi:signal transduction histidine kinase